MHALTLKLKLLLAQILPMLEARTRAFDHCLRARGHFSLQLSSFGGLARSMQCMEEAATSKNIKDDIHKMDIEIQRLEEVKVLLICIGVSLV